MKRNKGFTLIELLAVILILGIIALIAIPTVNGIIKDARTGAWQSTGSQMAKAAENYFELKQLKNEEYVTDFKTAASSTDGKYFASTDELVATGTSATSADTAYQIMQAALSLKGDIPTAGQIDTFTIGVNGDVALKFTNNNAYCATVASTTTTVTADTPAVAGGNIVCTAKN